MIKTGALYLSLILLLIVLAGALRTVFEHRWLFIRSFDDKTRQAYLVLTLAAVALLCLGFVDLRRIESFKIGGVEAKLVTLQQRVETLSDHMEVFFRRKRIEVFDKHNWNHVRRVGSWRTQPPGPGQPPSTGPILEVTLEQVPIPGSIEVFEGVLLMPEQKYVVNNRVVRFPANTDKPIDGVTIKYYPRIIPAEQTARP